MNALIKLTIINNTVESMIINFPFYLIGINFYLDNSILCSLSKEKQVFYTLGVKFLTFDAETTHFLVIDI